jgi:hypothetical protein
MDPQKRSEGCYGVDDAAEEDNKSEKADSCPMILVSSP